MPKAQGIDFFLPHVQRLQYHDEKRMEGNMQKTILLVAALFLFSGTAISQKPSVTFPAKDFWQKFEDDRQKAKEEYIGKTMNFTGVVIETGMSIYLTPNVKLSDSPDGPVYLICVLPRADTGKLSEYTKGDRITMTGRVYSSNPGKAVVIKECKRAGS